MQTNRDRISAAFAQLLPESREADLKAMAGAMGKKLPSERRIRDIVRSVCSMRLSVLPLTEAQWENACEDVASRVAATLIATLSTTSLAEAGLGALFGEEEIVSESIHASDCAIHSGPAYEPEPCDCGATNREAYEQMPDLGRVTWISSDEDSGPDCGLTLGLGNDEVLHCGELSNRTLEDHGIDVKETGDGWWIALFGKSEGATEIAALVVDTLAAQNVVERLSLLAREASDAATLRALLAEALTVLEPWVRHGRACGALGGDPGPFWLYTDDGYRDVPADDFIAISSLTDRLKAALPTGSDAT